MLKKLNRRSFIKKSAAVSAATVIGGNILSDLTDHNGADLYAAETVDISVVKGKNYYDNTVEAVKQLGGMEKFVPKDSKVALLPNVQRNNPGTFTKPEILRAVIRMCKKAGAKEINCLSWLPQKNWDNTGLAKVIKEEGANLVLVDKDNASLFKAVKIKNGKALKEALIMKELYNNDVLINLPITKDHAGNKFTGTMKNFMGLNSAKNNRANFHQENWQTDINAISHMEQCIADLNTVIKPDLCIVDATEFIITNGPMGPGEIITPQKVVAGTDRVAMDSYLCTLWGLKAKDIIVINKAAEHNLGETDLKKVNLKEIEI